MIDRRLVRMKNLRLLWLLTALGAACNNGTEPHFRPCTAADNTVTLAVNEYVSIDAGLDTGCTVYPATTLAAQYLVVPQIASGVPGQTAGFRLVGDTILPAPAPSPTVQELANLSAAERFHAYLRLGDERRSWGLVPEQGGPGLRPLLSIAAGPPGIGSLRVFQVCAKTDCTRFDRVGARVRALKSKVAIYV